jgi:hypothetical protein
LNCENLPIPREAKSSAIPADLLTPLEGISVIEQVADDLFETFVDGRLSSYERYPTWLRKAASSSTEVTERFSCGS